jgi:hypothetical protein
MYFCDASMKGPGKPQTKDKPMPLKLKHFSLPAFWLTTRIKRFDPCSHFMIFGEPRGGSTWLAETLCALIPSTAMLWEPINPQDVKALREIGFGSRQYIPEHADWNDAKDYLLQAPTRELQRILADWGISCHERLDEIAKRPSSTVRTNVHVDDVEKQLRKWQVFFSADTIAGMQCVLDHFGIDIYSSKSPLPQI